MFNHCTYLEVVRFSSVGMVCVIVLFVGIKGAKLISCFKVIQELGSFNSSLLGMFTHS